MKPALEQLKDWHKRLFELTEEMEQTYGPAGDYNTPALDAAVHVALHVAGIEYRDARNAERTRVPS